jgi:hypothetical protein
MSKVYKGLSNETLIGFVVANMIELLLYKDKLNIMNYLYSLITIPKNSVEDYAKKYFDKNSIVTPNFQAIILYNLNKRMIMINVDNKWVEAGPEDQREIAMSDEAKEELNINKSRFNKLIGFIGYEKNNKYLTFKTKDMDSTRDTGARCDESGKDKTLKKLTSILEEPKYSKLIMRPKLDKDGDIILDKDENPVEELTGHTELCVLLELLLRYLNDEEIKKKDINDKKNGMVYFLTPELAIYYKLYKVL